MRDVFRALLFVTFCAAPTLSCGRAPTKAQCEQLLDHVLDLEVAANGSPEMTADLNKQKAAIAVSIRQEFLDHCLRQLPTSQVECGLGSKTKAELENCDKL